MLSLTLTDQKNAPFRVLCLGAHSDDIEIGCGGTILDLVATKENAEIWWVVFSAKGERRKEAVRSASFFLKSAKRKKVVNRGFRDGFFPADFAKVKEAFEELKRKFQPDLIFTHYRNDLHQDHRTISDLTWNTFRSHLILEYEVPKYDGDLGSPNLFVHLNEHIKRLKIQFILDNFKTQRQKHWFTEETLLSMMRLRGVESGESRYSEAFYCRKLVIAL